MNEVVVAATGGYAHYKGSLITERLISADPNWVSEISFNNPNRSTTDETGVSYHTPPGSRYDFRITSEGGWYDAILEPTSGEQIGERFQNPVYDPSGSRIGTNQGYGFNFVSSEDNKQEYQKGNTTEYFQGNRIFYLEGGELNFFDQAIVYASGIYREYSGGMIEETVTSTDPLYVSVIKLIPPSDFQRDNATNDDSESQDGNTTNDDKSSGGTLKLFFVPQLLQLCIVLGFSL